MFYWLMKNWVVGPIVKAAFRPWIIGHENIPTTGGVILASNHLSFIDSVFLPLVIDRQISFLAKSDYFTGKGLKGWVDQDLPQGIRACCPSTAPAARPPRRRCDTGLRRARRAATCSGIYPEGTRSPDGKLYRGRTGVARMVLEAARAGGPGRDDRHRRRSCRSAPGCPRSRRIGIVIGEPLDFSRFAGMEGDRFILRSVTDEIMYELRAPQRPGVCRRLRVLGQGEGTAPRKRPSPAVRLESSASRVVPASRLRLRRRSAPRHPLSKDTPVVRSDRTCRACRSLT